MIARVAPAPGAIYQFITPIAVSSQWALPAAGSLYGVPESRGVMSRPMDQLRPSTKCLDLWKQVKLITVKVNFFASHLAT